MAYSTGRTACCSSYRARALPDSKASLQTSPCRPVIAIIVPFRKQAEQDRATQLKAFVEHMGSFLLHAQGQFILMIVEQSDDGRKFNRGQLLNIGFAEVCSHISPSRLSAAIFHDVDLLPNKLLLPWYDTCPRRGQPVHIAGPATWSKYAGMGQYEDVFFGGVTAFHPDDFVSCNGYPNNYWGWGLEDDQLRLRADESGCLVHGVRRPPFSSGAKYRDLDEVRVLNILQDPARRVCERHLWNDMFIGRQQGLLTLDDGWSDSNGLRGLRHTILRHGMVKPRATSDVSMATSEVSMLHVVAQN